MHLKQLLSDPIELIGGDLAESSLTVCRSNPNLAGVQFEKMNILSIPETPAFDVVVVNAVLYMMEDHEFHEAVNSIGRALRPGGLVIAFDFFHPYPHDVHIQEISKSHPAGLRLRFRQMRMASESLVAAGFSSIEFRPFTLPIDLPPSGNEDDLITYTIQAHDGRKLPFRGTLFQPWCHMQATKA